MSVALFIDSVAHSLILSNQRTQEKQESLLEETRGPESTTQGFHFTK